MTTGDKWDFFCRHLTKHEREYLIANSNGAQELDSMLDQLRARPKQKVQLNHVGALYELAGKYADGYTGGGWMALRGLLVEYHHAMKKLDL